jgi:hypothetical protein
MRPAWRMLTLPPAADMVVAQPADAAGRPGGRGFGQGPVGLAGSGALHCPVRAVLVVVLAEGVELVLQAGQGGGGRLPVQPAFLGLVEPLDLALGLRVKRSAVLLRDGEGCEQVLEGVPPAAGPGGADATVAGERRGGQPVGVAGLQERVDDDFAGDRRVGAGCQQVAGVVVEPVDDLGVGSAGQGPVGEPGCQHSFGRAASKRR